jgi:uncharacterized protein
VEVPVVAVDNINGKMLKKALIAAESSIERHIEELNELNVYPVPDGDTGNNMYLTLQAANESLNGNDSEKVSEVCDKFSMGALLGARGNSGVILSQILRGFSRGLKDKDVITTADFAAALRSASDTAYKAITDPVEGTILTVIREAADSALSVSKNGADLIQIIKIVTESARGTVARTTEMLPALKKAGVVDAGGKGLLYFFIGLQDFITDKVTETEKSIPTGKQNNKEQDMSYGYDVQFLMEGDNMPLSEIRQKVESMGESVLVVGDESLIRVHVHTHNPQQVLDYCASKGTLSDIINDNMDDQVENLKKQKQTSKGSDTASSSR